MDKGLIRSQLNLLDDILDMSKPHLTNTDGLGLNVQYEVSARVNNVRDELLDMLVDIPVPSGHDWSDMGNAID